MIEPNSVWEHFEKVGQSNYIGSYKAGQFKHARL